MSAAAAETNMSSVEVPPPDTADIAYVIGEILIAIATIFGNSLVLAAIYREPRLQTVNNYFIANLAAADLLVGILGIPCALLPTLGVPKEFGGCLFVNSVVIILTQISIFGLLAIALERFVAIRYPFTYKVQCTPRRTLFVIAVVWVAGVAVGAAPLLGWNRKEHYKPNNCLFTEVIDMEYMVYFNFFGCVLGPLLAMFGIYCYIFHIVRGQIQQISSLHQAAVTAITYSHRQNEKLLTAAQKQTKDAFAKEAKAAKWFAIVILVFALCWLPLHIINTIIVIMKQRHKVLMLAAILLSHTNSAINPVLYAYANTKFKTAFRKIFLCEVSDKEAVANSNSPDHQSLHNKSSSQRQHVVLTPKTGGTLLQLPLTPTDTKRLSPSVAGVEITFQTSDCMQPDVMNGPGEPTDDVSTNT